MAYFNLFIRPNGFYFDFILLITDVFLTFWFSNDFTRELFLEEISEAIKRDELRVHSRKIGESFLDISFNHKNVDAKFITKILSMHFGKRSRVLNCKLIQMDIKAALRLTGFQWGYLYSLLNPNQLRHYGVDVEDNPYCGRQMRWLKKDWSGRWRRLRCNSEVSGDCYIHGYLDPYRWRS